MATTIKKSDSPNKKSGLQRAKVSANLFVARWLAIPILFFLIFWLYANFDSLLLSFQREKYDENGMHLFFTVKNYVNVFTGFFKSGDLMIAFRNTMIFFWVNLLVVIPIALLMSYFIYKKIMGYKVFRTITYLPNIICSSALVVIYKYTFMAGGPCNALAEVFGNTYEYPLATDNAIYMLVLYNIIFGFGGSIVIFGGAMNSISADVLEAGEIDGCNWFQEFIYLIIPMIWPTMSTLLILSFSSIFSATGPILAMTGGRNNTQTLAFILYGHATGAAPGLTQDIYYASAIGMVMTLIAFPLVILIRKLMLRGEN